MGVKWTSVETEKTEKYRFVSVAYNGKVFVIVDDTNYALVSSDGLNWQGIQYILIQLIVLLIKIAQQK